MSNTSNMALNIKNVHAEKLAMQLAKLEKTSMTQAVIVALEARKEAILRERGRVNRLKQARAILEDRVWGHLPGNELTPTPDDDVLGFGKSGT